MNFKKIVASMLVILGFSSYAWMEKTKNQNENSSNSKDSNTIHNATPISSGVPLSQEVVYGGSETGSRRVDTVTSSTPQAPASKKVSIVGSVTNTRSTVGTSSSYKDGTYTGDSVDVYYGNIQVQAIIRSGKIADVSFLSYPSDRQRSLAIANRAMPVLSQEAITIQGSQVDAVSGATATSSGFRQSLASALVKAK
jgi:uncharacterized protein with FMN-binding domain